MPKMNTVKQAPSLLISIAQQNPNAAIQHP